MPGGSFRKLVKLLSEESKSLLYDTYNLAKTRIVSSFLHFALWALTLLQEEGTATTSFVSESLQTATPEKITIEDEEMFMEVAMQMYGGMLSSSPA